MDGFPNTFLLYYLQLHAEVSLFSPSSSLWFVTCSILFVITLKCSKLTKKTQNESASGIPHEPGECLLRSLPPVLHALILHSFCLLKKKKYLSKLLRTNCVNFEQWPLAHTGKISPVFTVHSLLHRFSPSYLLSHFFQGISLGANSLGFLKLSISSSHLNDRFPGHKTAG